MLKQLITSLLIMTSTMSIAQTKFWVTIEEESQITSLESESSIQKVTQALPDSRRTDLQKVYEIQTGEVISFLQFVKSNDYIHTPQIIEDIELLYEPNDLNQTFSTDYALDLINAEEAWDLTHGEPFIEIGVLDSGFDTIQEELINKYNHFSPNTAGANIIHGTAVAITAAGKTNNNSGKSSIGFDCTLSLRNINYNEMLAATYSGVRVLNLSWASGCMFNPYYQSVINEVYDNGTVIIAAAGNGPTCGGANALVYPAAFDNVISVSSIDHNDRHQPIPNDPNSTHQHNDEVDLVAPGYNVALGLPNNQYTNGNGTSFAAPYVAGTAGLMLSVNPCLTPAEVENILKNTADDISDLNQNYAGLLGEGRLNAAAAVQMAKDLHPIQTTVFQNNSSCSSTPGVFVSLDNGSIANHTIQWSDGSHDWNRYDLPQGNYSFMITNTDGCMFFDTLSYAPNGPSFDYNNSVIVNQSNQQITDVNNDGVIRIKGTVVIEEGVEFSMNDKTIEFANNTDLNNTSYLPGSGIVVKQNAELEIVNCQISNVDECLVKWGGIEVLSNGLGQEGFLEMYDSEISNAKIGIATIAKNNGTNDTLSGGEIIVNGTSFLDNEKAILLEGTYNRMSVPQILNSTFINENVNDARLIVSNNVDFIMNSCYFEGALNLLPDSRGVGVLLSNAKILSGNFKPQTEIERNTFVDLEKALIIKNNTKENIIKDFSFQNNLCAISVDNSSAVKIINNQIELGVGSYEYQVVGVEQIGNSISHIYQNKFEGNNAGTFSKAIFLNNQSNKGNQIRNNEFIGQIGIAIAFQGDNKMDYLSCNNFEIEGSADIQVDEENNENGSLEIEKDLLLNRFSTCGEVSANLNMTASDLFLYEDSENFSPDCYTGNVQVNMLSICGDRQNKCRLIIKEENNESALMTGDDTEVLSTEYNEAQSNNEFTVYPNPSNGSFNVLTSSIVDKIKVFSSTGKLVKTIAKNDIQYMQNIQADSGVYSVVFYSNQNILNTEKLIIK